MSLEFLRGVFPSGQQPYLLLAQSLFGGVGLIPHLSLALFRGVLPSGQHPYLLRRQLPFGGLGLIPHVSFEFLRGVPSGQHPYLVLIQLLSGDGSGVGVGQSPLLTHAISGYCPLLNPLILIETLFNNFLPRGLPDILSALLPKFTTNVNPTLLFEPVYSNIPPIFSLFLSLCPNICLSRIVLMLNVISLNFLPRRFNWGIEAVPLPVSSTSMRTKLLIEFVFLSCLVSLYVYKPFHIDL